MKIIKMAIMFIIFVCLCSCSMYSAKPNFVQGNYYMTGDSNCIKGNVVNSNTIKCYTSDGKMTGYRAAMTDQQVQMYMHNENMANRTTSAVLSNSSNQSNKRPMYCSQGQVGPFGMPGC